jgi:multiple sugar transport system permease protein
MAIKRAALVLLATALAAILLLPLAYGIMTSLKTEVQLAATNSPILPSSPETYQSDGKSYDMYVVPLPGGETRNLALVEKGRESSKFLDPVHPDAGLMEWKGSWRTLSPAWRLDVQWGNFISAWNTLGFFRILLNTFLYASVSTAGMLCSSALVAYGFSRFTFPGKGAAFLVLMATIVLPPQVTLIPTYSFFFAIHWIGSWLPIIVPTFFANAFNVFLLRQFMMGVPREMDEAARIDGAGPMRTFLSIILAQTVPALVAVVLFHFFFCWNDFFGPLIYLAGKPDLSPISVGLTKFFNLYTRQNNLVQAAALISTVIPIGIFLYAQKYFTQGIVVTGVEK